MSGKYKLIGGEAYPVMFKKNMLFASEANDGSKIKGFINLPDIITPDVVVFEARYVQSGANLNKAYFDQVELVQAYNTVPFKALDREHELQDIVGHIYASVYIDRSTNKELSLEVLKAMDPIVLQKTDIDVIIGGIVYVDRFPELESPLSRKAPAISMESYFSSFDLLLSNGVRVTLEEAEALGWHTLVEQLMSSYDDLEELEAAHRVKVILADKSEPTLEVFKWLKGLTFSGGGLVANPACQECTIISTTVEDIDDARLADPECQEVCEDECQAVDGPIHRNCMDDCMDDCEGASVAAEKSNQLVTINLTQLDSYMKKWRESDDGKPLNFQVKDLITVVEDVVLEKSDVTDPFSQERDPNGTSKDPSICPQYKYEIWMLNNGDAIEGQLYRHWCTYGNDKCPTAGNRQFHECLRWYNREGDWIMDVRNFRDASNPFAPEGYEDDSDIATSSSASYKAMQAMVDSFLYQVESLQRDKELETKKRSVSKRLSNSSLKIKRG